MQRDKTVRQDGSCSLAVLPRAVLLQVLGRIWQVLRGSQGMFRQRAQGWSIGGEPWALFGLYCYRVLLHYRLPSWVHCWNILRILTRSPSASALASPSPRTSSVLLGNFNPSLAGDLAETSAPR